MTCMDILQAFFLLLFSLLSVHSKNHCPTSYCPNNTLPIQYPFNLQGKQQTQNCNQGIPILDLPNNGEFYIRRIDYRHSLIQLYDPRDCLPRRLMNLNLTLLDPLMTLDYTFYTCPSQLIALSDFTVINCLSNSSSSTVATHTVSSEVMKKLYRCSEIVTLPVPVTFSPSDFIGNQGDFILRVLAPYCESCPPRAPGLVSKYILEVAFIMISFFTIIMPSVICIGCCVHFFRMFRKEGRANSSNVT